jgi:lipoprotein-anchoring transpeptidase ErfK/SrfK
MSPGTSMQPAGQPDDDDDSDTLRQTAPSQQGGFSSQVQSQPLAPVGNGPAAPSYSSAAPMAPAPGNNEPRYSSAPMDLNAPGTNSQAANPQARMAPQGMPPASAPFGGPGPTPNSYPDSYRQGSAGPDGLRPPGDIDNQTASVATSPRGAMPPAAPGTVPQNTSLPNGNAASALPPEDQPEMGQPKELPPNLRRQMVEYWTKEPAGTIIIDTPNTYLYLVMGDGKALRYGIGVGREGFTWAGKEKISRMAEWPDWFPPSEMIERQPYLPRFMAGGESNPLGARALYIGKTLYRIHGTNQPSTIGTFVSSGCIRLVNGDIEDLYTRVKPGTKIVVLPGNPPAAAKAMPASATASNPAPQAR